MSSDLGEFLRRRREALPPEAVGLPTGSRRRTPGLRRGELATLAGVSVEYLARLEQGRDRHPSAQVLDALANALRLSTAERLDLRAIVKAADGVGCLVVEPPETVVRPSVRLLLERLEPTPAVVVNRLTDVLAYTAAFRLVMEPLGLFDHRNIARFVLGDPRARETYRNWPGAVVGDLRSTDPYVARLLAELGAPPAGPCPPDRDELHHPDVGELRLTREALAVADTADLRIIVYLPHDEETSSRLDRLVRTGPRAVGTSRLDTTASGTSLSAPTRNRRASQRTTSP
ncbi:helix-turn-helix domain-containing protein [Cryptosporangium phraense]|uniref:Helix-turn-helix domain-containing protein n=1 Tax=Cryptosporangium phraense TaxID=2593070 RepID=A0A545AZ56_9ACTN|nr:helix-turn-helix domain-containing protein [Cryptosporangium phraense]